jgi:glycosyltransferase involved in cell wall biosynthesis
MKMIQLVTQMEAGGAQRVAYLLKEEFHRRGHDSRLLFLYTKRPAYAGKPRVESLLDHPPSPVDYFKIMIHLAQLLSREKPDVFITHTHYANVMGHTISSLLRVPSRIAVQHNPTHTYPSLARVADRLLGSIGAYSHNVAVAGTVTDSIAQYPMAYLTRVTKVFNGVPEPAPSLPRHVTRNRWNIPPEAPLLINVGRFSHQKNQEFLIRLIEKDQKLHLVLVGDGELRELLHGLAVDLKVTDRVHFTGEVRQDEVMELISASDIYVLPSRFEAASVVMLEAMLLGIAIVSNDIPSAREFLGEDAILVDTTVPDKWLKAIRTLLARPDMASELTTRARIKAHRFTVPRMADAYEKLLHLEASPSLPERSIA